MRIKVNCKKCPNKNCFLKLCNDKQYSEIAQRKAMVEFTKGSLIIQEGNVVSGIYFIYSGKAKVFHSSPKGKTQIIRLARAGEILGHRGFGGELFYPIGVTALEDSVICFIEKDLYFKLLKSTVKLAFHLITFYAEELKISETRMRNLVHMNVKNRIVEALFMIDKVFGQKSKKGRKVLDVILTRKDIADIAGTTHEQVIRTLSEFNKDKLIETKGKQIIITNYKKLQSLIADY